MSYMHGNSRIGSEHLGSQDLPEGEDGLGAIDFDRKESLGIITACSDRAASALREMASIALERLRGSIAGEYGVRFDTHNAAEISWNEFIPPGAAIALGAGFILARCLGETTTNGNLSGPPTA
jgi:hypothetical protein